MKIEPLKTGEPCPCCGQPIQTTDPGTLYVLGWIKTMSGADQLAREPTDDPEEARK